MTTVCRHGFHNGITAYILQFRYIAIHRIIETWVVFVKAIFSCSNLKPDDGFLSYDLPEVFNETGLGLTDIIIA